MAVLLGAAAIIAAPVALYLLGFAGDWLGYRLTSLGNPENEEEWLVAFHGLVYFALLAGGSVAVYKIGAGIMALAKNRKSDP